MIGKIIVVVQPFGLGDIIFCQALAREWVAEGHTVIWPVEEHYIGIQKHFQNITIINKYYAEKELGIDFEKRDFHQHKLPNGRMVEVFPLRWSVEYCKVPYSDCMKSKYMMFKRDWTSWKNFDWDRDYYMEVLLMQKLNIHLGDRYNLISEHFTQEGGKSVMITPPDNGLRNIYLTQIEAFTLLDWSMIIEGAETISAVGSSINYLIELLECKAKEIHLYPRKPMENNFENYDYILDKERYNYILKS